MRLRHLNRCALRFLVLALALSLLGCGDPDGTSPPNERAVAPDLQPVQTPDPHAPQALPAKSPEAVVDRAIRHIIEGPGKPLLSKGLPIPHVHRKNLEHAMADLRALPEVTLARLDDPSMVRRITVVHPNNINPWLALLRVLRLIPNKPEDLVLRYTRPALEMSYVHVRREAVRCLNTMEHSKAVADLLVAFFEGDADDQQLAPMAVEPILAYGGEHAARGLTWALRRGSGALWVRVTEALAAQRGRAPTAEQVNALAWWGVLARGSGPCLPTAQPRLKRTAFGDLGTRAGPRARRAIPSYTQAIHPLPRVGWVSAAYDQMIAQPAMRWWVAGTVPGGAALCRLAQWGFAPARAAIQADRTWAETDPARARRAEHCMFQDAAPQDTASVRAAVRRWLINPPLPARLDTIQPLVMGIGRADREPEARELLRDLLRDMPTSRFLQPLEDQVFDLLRAQDPEYVGFLEQLLAEGGPEQQSRVTRLMLASGESAFLHALEAHRQRLDPRAGSDLWRRTIFLAASARDLAPTGRAQWIATIEERLAALPPTEGATLASVLLDFGESGHRAFAKGLQGPRRAMYLAAWPLDARLMSLAVARAVAAPVGRNTPRAELRRVLALAYHAFPPAAAADLAALRRRLPEMHRHLVDPVLDCVQHRTSR